MNRVGRRTILLTILAEGVQIDVPVPDNMENAQRIAFARNLFDAPPPMAALAPKRLRVCSEIPIHLQLRDRPANQEKRPAGATPPTFSCNCRLAGPVPLRFSALRAPSKTKIRVALHLGNYPSGHVRHSRSALAADSSECFGCINMRSFLSSPLVVVGKGLKLARDRSVGHGLGSAEQSPCCL
jgi:hypothetical protein